MKKHFIALAVLFTLSGCAIAPKFDNTEYSRFVGVLGRIQYASTLCNDSEQIKWHTPNLLRETNELEIYATYRPLHKEIKEAASLIAANMKEMHRAYWSSNRTPSVAYCVTKFKIMENSVKRILPVLGGLD